MLGDCAEILPTLGKVDAVVTDPPYGIGAAAASFRGSKKNGWRDYGDSQWDSFRPDAETMRLAIAAGKHAVVWGGNYFTDVLPLGGKWLIWDKCQSDFSLADAELAWCSFDGAIRRINYARALAMQDGKEHPTQKAIAVMKWCIDQLPKGCSTIIDPFLGAGTTGVAAVQMGLDFVGIEREERYFDIACRRIEDAQRQGDMFLSEVA